MALPDEGVLVMDRTGRILHGNAAACEMLGYGLKELQQLTIRDTYPPEDVAFSEQLMRLLHLGEVPPPFRRRVRRRDNHIVLADVEWKILEDGRFRLMMRLVSNRSA
jgi:PAS domain S-box-containing protein